MKSFVVALACLLPSLALAAPPAAPTLSVAASNIRQLEFRWDSVPGVARYELWFLPGPGAAWVKYAEQPAQRATLFRVGVSVHLLDWRAARYYVNACNPSGCTPSNEVGVDGEQLAAIGFVKPQSPRSNRHFGSNVAVSADGLTFATMSSESIGTKTFSPTLHVFRRNTLSSGWHREARLVPSVVESWWTGLPGIDSVAISGDGNLAILSTGEHHDSQDYQGAVYLFRRSGTTWTESQKLTLDVPDDEFGYVVKLDEAGRTIAVMHGQRPDRGLATAPRGTIEIYRDAENDGIDQFVWSATVPVPPNPYGSPDILACYQLAMSGDGRSLLRSCRWEEWGEGFTQVLSAPSWSESARLDSGLIYGAELSHDGSTAVVQNWATAQVWKLGTAGWESEGQLNGAINFNTGRDHRRIALSRDGKILALGVESEYTAGVGPLYPPYVAGPNNKGTGSVAIFQRKPSGWTLRRLVKPGSTNVGFFGNSVALGDNGRLLIVGAPVDPSAATGIDGDRTDASSPERGAVWIY